MGRGDNAQASISTDRAEVNMYHVTRATNRSSILQSGLRATGRGVFLTVEREEPFGPFDVWEVDVSGLELKRDPNANSYDRDDWYSPQDISVQRLRLLTE